MCQRAARFAERCASLSQASWLLGPHSRQFSRDAIGVRFA